MPALGSGSTLLVLSGPGLPPYASRQMTQSLEPIEAEGQFRRTVNGSLQNLSPTQFRKYRSRITGKDIDAPAFDAVNLGDTLTVSCAIELGYLTSGGSPARTVVSGSSRVEGDYTYYRPELTMMVVGKNESLDEYGGDDTWELLLEEV